MRNHALLFIIYFLLFISCSTQQKFVERTESEINRMGEPVNKFSFDPKTTELYVRTVVKVESVKQVVKYQKPKDKYRVYYELKNLERTMTVNTDKVRIVEEQYLLFDTMLKKVLIVNNVPNYFERLFSAEDLKRAGEGKGTSKAINKENAADVLFYDIWKFNQFRFGDIQKVKDDSAIYTFYDVADIHKKHVWYIKKDLSEEVIYLKRFAEKDLYNEDIREVRPTYPIDMKFRKIENFKFLFYDNRKGFTKDQNKKEREKKNEDKKAQVKKDSSEIRDNMMELYKYDKQWFLVFKLTKPPLGMNPYIVFENGTIYAGPYFKN